MDCQIFCLVKYYTATDLIDFRLILISSLNEYFNQETKSLLLSRESKRFFFIQRDALLIGLKTASRDVLFKL